MPAQSLSQADDTALEFGEMVRKLVSGAPCLTAAVQPFCGTRAAQVYSMLVHSAPIRSTARHPSSFTLQAATCGAIARSKPPTHRSCPAVPVSVRTAHLLVKCQKLRCEPMCPALLVITSTRDVRVHGARLGAVGTVGKGIQQVNTVAKMPRSIQWLR